MRTKLVVILTICILVLLNYSIYQKEQLKTQGETLLLELVPVDPRSLMQGDYMRLRYAIERSTPAETLAAHQKRGYMVVAPDEKNVAQFVRFHTKEKALDENERLLHFHKRYRAIKIVPDAFFFQEGHAQHYENSTYGVFVFDDTGNHMLIGLADENGKTIAPIEDHNPDTYFTRLTEIAHRFSKLQ